MQIILRYRKCHFAIFDQLFSSRSSRTIFKVTITIASLIYKAETVSVWQTYVLFHVSLCVSHCATMAIKIILFWPTYGDL
jgi:hypothetical protein